MLFTVKAIDVIVLSRKFTLKGVWYHRHNIVPSPQNLRASPCNVDGTTLTGKPAVDFLDFILS